jgi:hypothetical protein
MPGGCCRISLQACPICVQKKLETPSRPPSYRGKRHDVRFGHATGENGCGGTSSREIGDIEDVDILFIHGAM